MAATTVFVGAFGSFLAMGLAATLGLATTLGSIFALGAAGVLDSTFALAATTGLAFGAAFGFAAALSFVETLGLAASMVFAADLRAFVGAFTAPEVVACNARNGMNGTLIAKRVKSCMILRLVLSVYPASRIAAACRCSGV